MSDLRKHPRFQIDGLAVIWVIGGDGERQKGRVSNLSEGGLQLRLPSPISLGEAVQVEIEGDLLIGVVRYSETDKNEWLIGLELHNWISKSRLEELALFWAPPEHLNRVLRDVPFGTVAASKRSRPSRNVVDRPGSDRREIESDRA